MYPWIRRTLDFWLQFCEKKCGLYMDVYGNHFIYVSSVFSRAEALLIGETGIQINTNQINSNVGFWWEGKTGVPVGKTSRRVEKQITHIWRQIRESNPGHVGGGPVLSPLRRLLPVTRGMLCKFHSAWTESRKSTSLLDFISHLISSVFIMQ